MSLRKLLFLLLFPCVGFGQVTINGMPNQAVTNIATCLGGAASVINGVSYTNCYPQSTYDARVNAAMSDAENGTNGNTTYGVDSTYEAASQTCVSQITVGDGTHPVWWRIGAGLYCSVTLTGGTGYAVYQNPGTSIVCVGVQAGGCTFSNYSAASGIYAVYGNNGSGYYYMDGVYFKNLHGSTLASGHVGIITGGLDGSLWTNDQWQDAPASNPSDTAVVLFNGGCCHANFTNDEFDSEWGQIAIDIEGTHINVVNFQNNTFNSHGSSVTGNPNILCHDTGPGVDSVISFTGTTYMEGQTGAMTAPWIQDNGCRALEFTGALEANSVGGTGTTSPIIDISSAFETTLHIGNVVAYSSAGTWTYPATIVRQHNTTADCGTPPCNVAVTDSSGNSPGYNSRTAQFDNINVGGALTAAALQSKLYTVSTLPAASSLAAGTQLTVSDDTSYTPGSCTGGGSDYMIAITNGSSWSCH